MENEEYIVYRVTSLKANGSVWTKNYEKEEELMEVLPILMGKFPHVIISKQTLRQSPLEYLVGMSDGNGKN
jgi:predicted glycosyltransferase